MKNYFFLFVSLTMFTGCLRLDDNLFNPNVNKITEYKFNNYPGDVDFKLDASYHIPDPLIHLLALESKAPGEEKPVKIYAVYIGDISRIATDTVIMYCHGNKDHMDFYWPRAQLLANVNGKNNYGVMMVDYRGYGLSEGKPTEEGLYADVDAGLKWLQANGLSRERLVMYGFSLGSAPATLLSASAHTLEPSKLLLEAPFASAKVMVQDATRLALPAGFFTDLQINNADAIKYVDQPLFWIHGTADDFLNINTHGQLVYDNHRGRFKEAHRITGANHGDIPNTLGFSAYMKLVGDFIRK